MLTQLMVVGRRGRRGGLASTLRLPARTTVSAAVDHATVHRLDMVDDLAADETSKCPTARVSNNTSGDIAGDRIGASTAEYKPWICYYCFILKIRKMNNSLTCSGAIPVRPPLDPPLLDPSEKLCFSLRVVYTIINDRLSDFTTVVLFPYVSASPLKNFWLQ